MIFLHCFAWSFLEPWFGSILVGVYNAKEVWIWIFGFIVLVFNPLIPLRLGRDLWRLIDLLVAVFLLVSLFVFKLPKNKIK